MPKVVLRYSEQARSDLAEIFQQRLAQRGAEGWDSARAYVAAIVTTIEGIADYPERGPIPPELEAIGERGWRQALHAPYRVIYLLEEDAATVALVADSRRDSASLLQARLLGG
ncbi:MAG: type II toxin-antitoxin system RelE/ParE family toxin [Pseudomonadota bacterium]